MEEIDHAIVEFDKRLEKEEMNSEIIDEAIRSREDDFVELSDMVLKVIQKAEQLATEVSVELHDFGIEIDDEEIFDRASDIIKGAGDVWLAYRIMEES